MMISRIRRGVMASICILILCGTATFGAYESGTSLPGTTPFPLRDTLSRRSMVPIRNRVVLNEFPEWEGARLGGAAQNARPSHGQTSKQSPERRDTNPSSFDDLVARARAAMAAEKLSEAIRLYGMAVRQRPSWSEGWWFLGTLNFDTGHYTEASDAFTHFVNVEKKQPGPGFGMLGLSELNLKNYQPALAALEQGIQLGLGTDPAFIHSVLYSDGILNNLAGQHEIALQRLTLVANKIAAANPQDPEQVVLGDADLLDAFGLAALRIAKLPSDVSAAQAPLVREAGHAEALIALQDRATAGDELKELVALYPSEPGVHYMYGVYLLKENPPLALGEFHRELQISPTNAVARIRLALEYLRLGEYDQGLEEARKAIALVPGNFIAHIAYGRLLLMAGKPEDAIKELRTAVKLAPGSPDAHLALSQALSRAGRATEAAHERATFDRLKAIRDSSIQKR